MRNALITANVFQNVFKDILTMPVPYQRYYVDLLRRLAAQPVTWYMTALDYALAYAFWDLFRLREDEVCQEAYLQLLQRVRICPIDEWILEEASNYHQINFCDALRLACAVAYNLDAIVTWEPYLFVRTVKEHQQFESNWYLFVKIPSESAEPDNVAECRIGVFSVGAFLLSFHSDEEHWFTESQQLQYFRLERCYFITCGEHNEASIMLCGPSGELLEATVQGNSPFDAIQKAVDQIVNECFPTIPPRHLSRFFVPQATLFGADAPIEVVIRVECASQSFQEGASHSSVFQAATDAYIKVINKICQHPNLSNVA
jgi:predicted nucleic acid-binding protein